MKTGMVDLKRPKPKKSEEAQAVVCESYEKYPYGTRISLGNEELEKLKVDIAGLRVGQEVVIKGKCEVCEVSSNESMDSDGKPEKRKRLELQIQKLSLSSQDSFGGGYSEEDE